ncbi:MAG: hypothetical protein JSW47_14610 [Phycisphaerales bacterium]|nr:MAG: hypothetical protein JSW47_14610 [Phycisphaerales bacterium]
MRELHGEAFLDELRPDGMMESMLAERILSLTRRLRRAALMQNQSVTAAKLCNGRFLKLYVIGKTPH